MKYIWTPFLGLILSGCGTVPQADPEAVSNFVPHELDEGDDMGVYLIRPNQIAGSGRDYWVAYDGIWKMDLSIDVQADKYHYVELEQSFSFTGYNHGLTFVGSEKSVTNDKVNGWMESLTEYTPIPKEEWSDRQSSHVERGLFYLQQNMPLFSEKN